MNAQTTRLLLFAGFLGLAAPAAAQVHLQIDGGITRAARTDQFVAGELGVRLAFLEIDIEGGRLNDVLPKGILSQLDQLQRDRGLAVQVRPSLPASYVLGSIRLISPGGFIKPFITAGYGMARVEPRLDVVIPSLPVSDVFGIATSKAETDPMLAGGLGLRITVAPRVHADIAYRYLRIFSDFHADTNFGNDRVLTSAHVAYAGLGVQF
jgi:hypothetical protein